MAKTGLQNETLISELLISGSSSPAISRNEFGVYSFDQANRSDGVISGQLTRPKYNETELVKSVDTVIFELLPPEAPPFDDRVPRPIYNEVTQSVIDLTEQVIDLTTLVFQLRAKVQDVEIVSESLRVDVDLQSLNVAASQNQTQQITTKITSTITELQNSIQKGVAEAIQRVSLFARNQALEQELTILRDTLFGKQAKQAEGSKVTDDVAAKVLNKSDEKYADIVFRGRAKDDGNGSFINGPDIQLKNFTKDKLTVSFKFDGGNASAFNKISDVTLEAGEEKVIKVTTNKKGVDGYKPSSGFGTSGDKEHTGNLIVKSPKGSITFTTSIQKMRGTNFTP
jgi:hypothetical protein